MTDKSNYINEVSLRYANALMLTVGEDGVDKVLKNFETFIEAINKNRNLSNLISNPLINNLKKSAILEKICIKLKTEKTFLGFILTLTKHSKIILINKVFEKFNQMLDQKNGLTEVYVTTSSKLDVENEKKIIKVISEKINLKIKLKRIVDPDIIGGIIIRINSLMIDNSIKTKLSESNL